MIFGKYCMHVEYTVIYMYTHFHMHAHAHTVLYSSTFRSTVSLLRNAPTSLIVVHVLQVEVDYVVGAVLRTSVAEVANVPTVVGL